MLKVFIFKLSAVDLPAVACVLAVDGDPAVADIHVVPAALYPVPLSMLLLAPMLLQVFFSVVGLLLLASLHHNVAS
jgi:hypothetical protein